mmetsp:Transcript_11174/g.36786  ORF Transcript_11174/g.36786 Transcript_11174/m.36786 type:complete len:81 (+) Transcript_11174:716-958(+)
MCSVKLFFQILRADAEVQEVPARSPTAPSFLFTLLLDAKPDFSDEALAHSLSTAILEAEHSVPALDGGKEEEASLNCVRA